MKSNKLSTTTNNDLDFDQLNEEILKEINKDAILYYQISKYRLKNVSTKITKRVFTLINDLK